METTSEENSKNVLGWDMGTGKSESSGSRKLEITTKSDNQVAAEETTADQQPVSENEEKQPSRTEIQEKALDKSKYSVMAYLLTNTSGTVILSLDSEQDYKQGRWHYVPKDIPADLQPEFNNKKYCFELYCTADKNSQKRLKKLIRRFMPGVEIGFLPVKVHAKKIRAIAKRDCSVTLYVSLDSISLNRMSVQKGQAIEFEVHEDKELPEGPVSETLGRRSVTFNDGMFLIPTYSNDFEYETID